MMIFETTYFTERMERNRLSEQEEVFDIFTSTMEKIGTASRSEVHDRGLWHQTFHCWIVSKETGKPSVLLQHRHPDKDTFPGLLDISSAGHLKAGELVEEGIRELEEELGIKVSFNALLPCGVYAEEDYLPDHRVDREFCHIFILGCDQPLTQYQFQREEIIGLCLVDANEFEQLILGNEHTALAKSIYLTEDGQLEESTKYISIEDIVPHDKAYYDVIIQALKNAHSDVTDVEVLDL
jgi:isopentenyldiphosphate isomerase